MLITVKGSLSLWIAEVLPFVTTSCSVRGQSRELKGQKAARPLAICAPVEQDQIHSDHTNKFVITMVQNLMEWV